MTKTCWSSRRTSSNVYLLKLEKKIHKVTSLSIWNPIQPFLFGLLGRSGEVYLIGDISLVGAPFEKGIKDPDADFLLDDPVPIEVVVLSHLPDVFLDEVIDVLAE